MILTTIIHFHLLREQNHTIKISIKSLKVKLYIYHEQS